MMNRVVRVRFRHYCSIVKTRLVGINPFIYFGEHIRAEAGKQMLTVGQLNCYVIWEQYDGVTLLERDGHGWQIDPGDVFLAEPGTAARWVATARVTRLVFDLVPRRRRLNAEGLSYPSRWTPQPSWEELFGVSLEPRVPEPWAQQARDLVSFGMHTNRQSRLFEWLEVGQLLGLWVARYVGSQGRPRVPEGRARRALCVVQKAELLLASRFDPRKTIGEVAGVLGISRGHLTRLFKEVRGYGPAHARLLFQIKAAQKLMLRSDRNLSTIAQMTGFASARGLRQAFRKVVGMSPGQWRRQYSP